MSRLKTKMHLRGNVLTFEHSADKEKLKEISEDFIQSYSPEKQALEIENIKP